MSAAFSLRATDFSLAGRRQLGSPHNSVRTPEFIAAGDLESRKSTLSSNIFYLLMGLFAILPERDVEWLPRASSSFIPLRVPSLARSLIMVLYKRF